MLNIVLCEDDLSLLNTYQLIIKNYLQGHPDQKLQVRLATANPNDLNTVIKALIGEPVLYVLDIEFANSKYRGIELAAKIRSLDLNAKIVFVTTHEELALLTFQRKVEPLDYISKELGITNLQQALTKDIQLAIDRYSEQAATTASEFTYHLGARNYAIPMTEINYFEASPHSHKLILHSVHEIAEFPGDLNRLETDYPRLFRAHRSVLVNPQNIRVVDQHSHQIIFQNTATCDIARRQVGALKQLLKH